MTDEADIVDRFIEERKYAREMRMRLDTRIDLHGSVNEGCTTVYQLKRGDEFTLTFHSIAEVSAFLEGYRRGSHSIHEGKKK